MDENARRLLATELMRLIEVRQVARRLEIEAAIEGLCDWQGSDQAAFRVKSQNAEFWLEVDLFDTSTRAMFDGKVWEMKSVNDVKLLVRKLRSDYHLRWFI